MLDRLYYEDEFNLNKSSSLTALFRNIRKVVSGLEWDEIPSFVEALCQERFYVNDETGVVNASAASVIYWSLTGDVKRRIKKGRYNALSIYNTPKRDWEYYRITVRDDKSLTIKGPYRHPRSFGKHQKALLRSAQCWWL